MNAGQCSADRIGNGAAGGAPGADLPETGEGIGPADPDPPAASKDLKAGGAADPQNEILACKHGFRFSRSELFFQFKGDGGGIQREAALRVLLLRQSKAHPVGEYRVLLLDGKSNGGSGASPEKTAETFTR